MTRKIQTKSHESLRRHLLSAAALTVILVFGMGGWAATVELSGAVITSGQVVVDSNVKKVQHPTGGIVGELRVRDGDASRKEISWFVSTKRRQKRTC